MYVAWLIMEKENNFFFYKKWKSKSSIDTWWVVEFF